MEEVLKRDNIMRISLAFYEFVRLNSDWPNRIENVISDRYPKISDFDFEYEQKLYSFFYEYIDKYNVRCCVKEYDSFFDTTPFYQYLLFDYSMLDGHISRVYKQGIYKNKVD